MSTDLDRPLIRGGKDFRIGSYWKILPTFWAPRLVVGSRGWGPSDRKDFRRGVYFCRFSTLGPERQNTSPPAGICSPLFSRRPDKRQDKFRPAGKNTAAFEDRYFS